MMTMNDVIDGLKALREVFSGERRTLIDHMIETINNHMVIKPEPKVEESIEDTPKAEPESVKHVKKAKRK